MRPWRIFLLIGFALSFMAACRKNKAVMAPVPENLWTIQAEKDTGYAISQENNILFTCFSNTGGKSITLSFDSTVLHSNSYVVADTLLNYFECRISINNGNNQIYQSTGRAGDMVYETLVNYFVSFSFNNIQLASGSDTLLVSGTLKFPSVY
jgi:hypothetical protein